MAYNISKLKTVSLSKTQTAYYNCNCKEKNKIILTKMHRIQVCIYGKCPNILSTKVSHKMAYANNVDTDQIWSGSTLFAILQSILRNNCLKNKLLAKK